MYKQRNTVERGFGRFKQWRGIATRYDKYARTYRVEYSWLPASSSPAND